MSNNLVSQQLPVPSIQMGQVEHMAEKLDSSMPMGLMGTKIDTSLPQMSIPNGQMGSVSGPPVALTQHISISNTQGQSLQSRPVMYAQQKLPLSNTQMGQLESQAYNLISPQDFLVPNKQMGQMGTGLNSVGLQEPSISGKRKAPMEVTAADAFAAQKFLVPNKRVMQMEHRPWLQPLSSSNQLPLQQQPVSNSSAPQRPQAPSKRPAPKGGLQQVQRIQTRQMQPSPKGQRESSESVRSKLRESLAAALALVLKQQDKISSAGNDSQGGAVCNPQKERSQSSGHHSSNGDAVDTFPMKEDPLGQKSSDGQNASQKVSIDGRNLQSSVPLRDEDVSFSDSFFVKDELLQGNGLTWVLDPDVDLVGEEIGQQQPDRRCVMVQNPETLASKIEAELFKLFGGVNKKYREKGRSLLFNLKDRNNPELRERVMSGEIPPERLCAMTAEELASRELSEWRIAKAEELAQMVVLPDMDVDVRRLVKKTHKGEFQVEVEEQDTPSAEVAAGLNQIIPKSNDNESSSSSKETKGKANVTREKGSSEEQDADCTITIPSNEGTDLMQGLMVEDEFKDADLPPIVSLDEFMESLNSEPPFEDLPENAGKRTPNSGKENSAVGSESKSQDVRPKDPVDTVAGESDSNDATNVKSDADGRSIDSPVDKSESTNAVLAVKGEQFWVGLLQFSLTSLVTVVGRFKSGERTSSKDWPGMIEIKGRVRLDAFQKFLQELPMSRSRAVMALHFVCRDGSSDGDRATFSEAADSYVVEERVGFAEPTRGVELYLCPANPSTREMLGKVLPKEKEQVDALNAIDNGLIGVVVWRKAHVTSSTISSNSASHHKHNSKKQHLSSTRRYQEKDVNVNVKTTSEHPFSRGQPKSQPVDDDADVPPGFGPANGDDDDLPEFNFSSDSSLASKKPRGVAPLAQHPPPPSLPVNQMRELVHRYGQPKSNAPSGKWQAWDDDEDDDIPEWKPDQTQFQRTYTQQQVQTMPRGPPLPHPHLVQQTMHHQQPIAQSVHGMSAAAMPLQTQVNIIHGQQQAAGAGWMPRTPGSHGLSVYQPNGAQSYGAPGQQQQGSVWRGDGASRGF